MFGIGCEDDEVWVGIFGVYWDVDDDFVSMIGV